MDKVNYRQEDWVGARALTLLHEGYPGISHATTEAICLRLKDLVSESTAESIERRRVEEIIEHVRLQAPELKPELGRD